ncbi:MAG: flagellar export chaperone FliS [Chloroflexi bacterium]|nr:flagellar export chaperone FliS [Chloroflexota bacterium]
MQSTMIQTYRRMQVHTTTPPSLVVMLIQAALRFLVGAKEALAKSDLEKTHGDLVRVQDIIGELMGALDLDKGEIASNLFSIYEYMMGRLVEANVKKEAKAIGEVESLLGGLLPAWQEIAREAG